MKEVCLLTRKLSPKKDSIFQLINGLRAREDGVKNLNGLSHITVKLIWNTLRQKGRRSSRRDVAMQMLHECYMHVEMKKIKEEESRKVEKLKSSMKDLDARVKS